MALGEIHISQIQSAFIWLMIAIALIVLVFTRMRLPDVQGTRTQKDEILERSIWSFSHLTLGIVAIFFYVGVEVCVGANINLYTQELQKSGRSFFFLGMDSFSICGINMSISALMATLYWGGMLVGRLISSFMNAISARLQLGIAAAFAGAFTIGAIWLDNPWLLVVIGLFHSVMWGAIFTLSVSKLGKYTSVASGIFMIGVIGGSLLPFCQGIFADILNGAWRWTWLIVVLGEAYILYYALYGSEIKESME